MGVNIDRVIVITFLIGGLMAGAAGLLHDLSSRSGIHWLQVGFLPGIKAFTAAVLGGIGNIRGAMLGGLLLGLVESVCGRRSSASGVDGRHRLRRPGGRPDVPTDGNPGEQAVGS